MTHARRITDAQVDRCRNTAVGFLKELIATSRLGEMAVQARVAAEARSIGCAVETIRYRPASVPMVEEFATDVAMGVVTRACVVGRLPGTGGGRSLILFAHPDSEPLAETSSWRHDPFAGTVDGGRLYGWSVADDLAGVATMVEALRAVLAGGLCPAGEVILASTPSKRHGRGISALLHGGLNADAALYLHPAESGAGLREVKAFASGQVEFRIVIEGRPPDTTEPLQTAFAHLAVNPIDKAISIYGALKAVDERRAAAVQHPLLQQAVGRSTNLMVSHIAAGNPTQLARSGATCVLGGALSFPPPETLGEVQRQIEAAVWEVSESDPWLKEHPPRLLWDAGVTGAEVTSMHPLYRVVSDAIFAVSGEAPSLNPMHTSSDIRNPIVQKGIPTVGLGPLGGDLAQNGRTDEWVDIEDFVRGVKVTAGVIVDWCGVSRTG